MIRNHWQCIKAPFRLQVPYLASGGFGGEAEAIASSFQILEFRNETTNIWRVIGLSLLSLFISLNIHGQSATDSAGIYSKDTVARPPDVQKFDVTGKPVPADPNVVVGADKIIPGKDTIPVVKKHSPTKALWMSAVLPGLGQAYNKKYWKIPIVYAGFAGLGYWIYFESHEFNQARTAYRAAVRNPPYYTGVYKGVETDASTIKTYRDYYKGFLNYASLATVLWYGLNLIDAVVDGHLYHFNVDDKLSLNFDPSFMLPVNIGMNQTCLGLTVKVIPLNGKKKVNPLSLMN